MTLEVLNPTTGRPIAQLERAGLEETDEAVARALAAYPAWRAVKPADRARLDALPQDPTALLVEAIVRHRVSRSGIALST